MTYPMIFAEDYLGADHSEMEAEYRSNLPSPEEVEEMRRESKWQVWIEGIAIGLPTTWEDAAKWASVLQKTFPDHRVGTLPL